MACEVAERPAFFFPEVSATEIATTERGKHWAKKHELILGVALWEVMTHRDKVSDTSGVDLELLVKRIDERRQFHGLEPDQPTLKMIRDIIRKVYVAPKYPDRE